MWYNVFYDNSRPVGAILPEAHGRKVGDSKDLNSRGEHLKFYHSDLETIRNLLVGNSSIDFNYWREFSLRTFFHELFFFQIICENIFRVKTVVFIF